MESEICLCGRIVFRLPANKLFQRKKNVKMIYEKINRNFRGNEKYNDMICYIKDYFLHYFDLIGKNKKRSNDIWNLCVANGLSSIISTSSIYNNLSAKINRCTNSKFVAKFILFNRGRIDIKTARNIIYDNFGKEKMVWWIEKLQIPEKIVFGILNKETFHHEFNMGIIEIYEAVKDIKDHYSAKKY
jgi:hypothetical protein